MLVAMMVEGEGDQHRRSSVPSLLRYEERASMSSTRQMRVKAKVTTNEIRENVRKRVDAGAEILCLRLAAAQMTRGEFESWLAMKEGILFDPLPRYVRGVAHGNWHVIAPPAKTASAEFTAKHYGYTERSVAEMDRSARRIIHRIRDAAGLTGEIPAVPVWPSIQTDESLLRYIFAGP